MTLLLDRSEATPQTHVLAIGVGTYRHLRGGEDPLLADDIDLVGRLESPRPSAIAFTTWVMTKLRNPRAQLGSVELLVSPSADGTTIPVDRPTIAAIKTAADDWVERCNQHPDNVAMFFFCGHGLGNVVTTLLLPEDFGASPRRPLERAIDFDLTYEAMGRCCKARTQCFFIDACRGRPELLRELQGSNAAPLVEPRVRSRLAVNAPILYSTSEGASAWALRGGQPTRYTRDLIRSLDGLGSYQLGSRWEVNTEGLRTAMLSLGSMPPDDGVPAQRVEAGGICGHPGGSRLRGGATLHVTDSPPLVPLAVTSLPEEALSYAALSLTPFPAGEDPLVVRAPAQGPWRVDVPASHYQLGTRFPGREHADRDDELLTIDPPVHDHQIDLTTGPP
jgi:hypothetical protein